jgi:hypothetical protein
MRSSCLEISGRAIKYQRIDLKVVLLMKYLPPKNIMNYIQPFFAFLERNTDPCVQSQFY